MKTQPLFTLNASRDRNIKVNDVFGGYLMNSSHYYSSSVGNRAVELTR